MVKWHYDTAEIIADGIVHAIGVAASLVAVTVLIFYATVWGSAGMLAGAWIYGLGLVASFGTSFAYNIWPIGPAKWILRRLDHSAIFILIAATYTPFLVAALPDRAVLVNLIGIWGVAACGIVLKCLWPGRYDRFAIVLYLVMGWSGLIQAYRLYEVLPSLTLVLILIGGILYSVGVIFHVWEKLRFQNAIWHMFVLAAAGVHYAAVLTCVVLLNA